MPRVGFIYHQKFLEHETGDTHPENRHRLRKLYSHLKEADISDNLEWIRAEMGSESDLLLNHESQYIEYVKKTCRSSTSALLDDGDTRVCDESFDVALLAVGAGIQAVDLVLSEKFSRVFVAARPPGHHALSNHAVGFCLFNNVAIAVKNALQHPDCNRVMVLDWDVHHGNGTQDSFYDRSDVLVCSIHQYPFFPGGGSSDEIGVGDGAFHTVNIPLGEGSGINQYREAMRNIVFPSAEAFNPDLLILSAGFDAHVNDPLANMNLRDEDFFELTELTVELANRFAGGKIISFLEGGHDKDSLARSVVQHITALGSPEVEE